MTATIAEAIIWKPVFTYQSYLCILLQEDKNIEDVLATTLVVDDEVGFNNF